MPDPQIKFRSIPWSWPTLSALTILFSIAVFSCTPTALPAQGIGEASVQLIDGTSFKCSIESIDQQGQVVGQGIPDGFNIETVISIQTQLKASKTVGEVTIYPVGGGVVFGKQLSLAEEVLSCKNSASGQVELPLQAIRAVVWSSSQDVQAAVDSPSKDNDQIIVQVPDGERVVSGILESVDGEFLQVNFKNESRKIGLAKVKAFVVADLGLKKPEGSMATVELIDGSRLVGVIGGLEN